MEPRAESDRSEAEALTRCRDRATLLTRQPERIRELNRVRYSVRRQLAAAALLVLLAWAPVTVVALADPGFRGNPVLLGVGLLVVLAAPVAAYLLWHRLWLPGRRAGRELDAWLVADRLPEARALPAGPELPVAMLTPYDLRDRPDFESHAGKRLEDAEPGEYPALVRLLPLTGLGVLVGCLVVSSALERMNAGEVASGLAGLLAGAILLGPALYSAWGLYSAADRTNGRWTWLGDDLARITAWRGGGHPPQAHRSHPRIELRLLIGLGLVALLAVLAHLPEGPQHRASVVLIFALVGLGLVGLRAFPRFTAHATARIIGRLGGEPALPVGVVESEAHCDGREYAAAVAVVNGTMLVGADHVAHHPLEEFRCATVFRSVDRLAPPRIALVRPDLTAITLVTRRPEPLVERLREAGMPLR